ncbi:MAG: M12 family metallopeptidase [Methyloversatilis sp.]|uniref:M12 family metallopeptidase n=1 Tax=Methyloversatilis sp. TaxID=2569862 RepID=UPI0025D9BFB3|nr:M12 family metallopeptidase [Methyloversatilis sp.]MCR6666326.1 M12 family metallopeptidase [Methyloversatilis sp.]
MKRALFGVACLAITTIVHSEESYLFPLKSGIWDSTTIGVCWENPSPDNNSEREWVRRKVGSTWESYSKLQFIGWDKCSLNNNGIRILIQDDGPHVKALGKRLDSMPNGMVLNFTFKNWSRDCQNKKKYCVEVIAVHEFGHAIGFAHEQNRQDAPDWCKEERQGPDGDMYITPFDIDSVMNYCNPKWSGDGNLSKSDKDGLNLLYGTSRRVFAYDFALQTPTALHETGRDFTFSFLPNGDLMAIKKSGGGSTSTEVHILTAASNYSQFRLQTGTALHPTGDEFAFSTLSNGDLMAIKKSGGGSTSTEVHILTAASNYSQFRLQTRTALHPTGGDFSFSTLSNGDLMAIKKSGGGATSTEVHILTAASNYSQFRLQTGTALHPTGDDFAFSTLANGDLMAVKKYGTGTQSTEVHILSAKSNYGRFVTQSGTGLHETDGSFEFLARDGNELVAIKKAGTGSRTTEVHVLMKKI